MAPLRTSHDGNGSYATLSAPKPAFDNLQELNFSHLLYFWSVAREGSIANACVRLQISQPTISMQIRKLEQALGHRLFDRSGRNLVLTEVGRTVYDYADDVFALGRELLGTLRGVPGKRLGRLNVGVPDYLPKLIIYRLLEPVLRLPQPVQLTCHQASLDDMVSGLSRHKYDAILTDTPIPSPSESRHFNHPLGECEIAICGSPALAERYREQFPDSVEGAPWLLPSTATEMRRTLDRWFDTFEAPPRVVGEFDDSALMKEFGSGGSGLFPIPSAVLPEVTRQYGVELVGRLPLLRARYFVVTMERKLAHPAMLVIAETAKSGLLSETTG